MKSIATLMLFGITLLLAGCGSGSSNTINGNWTAALTNNRAGSSPIFAFTVTLAAAGGNNLSITNLNFTTANGCFASGSIATGGFALSGNMSGVTSGGFEMNIQSAPTNGNNQLSLQGTVNNNTVAGNWTLTGTGSGCTGSGTFTMDKS
jgi:hypothetical protein